MARHPLTIICIVLVTVLVGATCAAILPGPAAAGRPPAPVNHLTVTSPTATTYMLNQGQQLVVSWRLDIPVSRGSFTIYDCTVRDGLEHALQRVDATTGTVYSTTIPVDRETFFVGGYRHVAVKYRPRASGAFTISGESPTFLVDCDPVPLETYPWGPPLSVASGQPATLGLMVTHAAPAPAVLTGEMILNNVAAGTTTRVDLDELVRPSWVVSTSWPMTAPMTFTLPPDLIPTGYYQWYVNVTLANGERNECAVVGELTVKAATKGRH